MGDPTAADSDYADNPPLYHADTEGVIFINAKKTRKTDIRSLIRMPVFLIRRERNDSHCFL
jgi:hypothetical protein